MKTKFELGEIFDVVDTIKKQLPIFCRECGEKLTIGGTHPNYVSWGCSYRDNENHIKPGRYIADSHYRNSVIYMDFNEFRKYETVVLYFDNIKNEIAQRAKNG